MSSKDGSVPSGGRRAGGGARAAALRFALRATTAGFFLLGASLILGRFTEARDWPAVLGTVEELILVETDTGGMVPGSHYRVRAAYRYEVDGAVYYGSTLAVYDWVYRSEERAHVRLEREGVRVGARVPVYYDPTAPERALLVRGIPWNRLEVILGLLFLGVLPVAVVVFSAIDLLRGGASRRDDRSRGRFW